MTTRSDLQARAAAFDADAHRLLAAAQFGPQVEETARALTNLLTSRRPDASSTDA